MSNIVSQVTESQPFDEENSPNKQPQLYELQDVALKAMRSIVTGNSELEKVASEPRQFSQVAQRLIAKTENLDQKAALATIFIQEKVAEGSYADAVTTLLFDGIPDADIPEMQNPDFVGELFEKAMQLDDKFQARRIAETMANLQENEELGKLLKFPNEESKYNTGWVARERNLFEEDINRVLALAEQTEGFEWDVFKDVKHAHDSWRFRDDGYYSEFPHPLATAVARVYCKLLAEQFSHTLAYQIALESKLPHADLVEYEKNLSRLSQIKARLERHFKM